jgi:hypothetical protein
MRQATDEPPRMFRLTHEELQVIERRGKTDPPELVRIPLRHVLLYETGTSLLNSWFTLTVGGDAMPQIFLYRYWTRWDVHFDEVYQLLSCVWLSFEDVSLANTPVEPQWIEQLDPHWIQAIRQEVSPDEPIMDLVVQAPLYELRRRWFKKTRASGRCLCLTPKRLLWLDEETGGQHLDYGLVRRIIPLSHIESMEMEDAPGETGLEGTLRLGVFQGRSRITLRAPVDMRLRFYYARFIDRWKKGVQLVP